MDTHPDFSKLVCLLEKEQNNPQVRTCLDHLKNGEVYFEPNDPLETGHLHKVYENRFLTQQNITKNRSVEGYQQLLDQLKSERDQRIRNFVIATDAGSFVVFTSVAIDRFISILQSSNYTLTKAKKLSKAWQQ
ncbi:MAG: hypothetical protein WA958_18680 [Tunicatimonas sp.]